MSRLRLVISASSEELRTARRAAAAPVRTPGFDPVSEDDFPTGGGKLLQWLRQPVDSCAALIQIAAHLDHFVTLQP